MPLNLKIRGSGADGDVIDVRVDPLEDIGRTVDKLISYWGLPEDDDYSLHHQDEVLKAESKWSDYGLEDGVFLALKKDESRRLPRKIWKKRIKNEVRSIDAGKVKVAEGDGVMMLGVTFTDTPGPVEIDGEIGLIYRHEFEIELTRDYPFQPPNVIWKTPVYHPNIGKGEGGRNVRMEYLDEWEVAHSISILIEKMRELLLDPDTDRKLAREECTDALEDYESGQFPSPAYR